MLRFLRFAKTERSFRNPFYVDLICIHRCKLTQYNEDFAESQWWEAKRAQMDTNARMHLDVNVNVQSTPTLSAVLQVYFQPRKDKFESHRDSLYFCRLEESSLVEIYRLYVIKFCIFQTFPCICTNSLLTSFPITNNYLETKTAYLLISTPKRQ